MHDAVPEVSHEDVAVVVSRDGYDPANGAGDHDQDGNESPYPEPASDTIAADIAMGHLSQIATPSDCGRYRTSTSQASTILLRRRHRKLVYEVFLEVGQEYLSSVVDGY